MNDSRVCVAKLGGSLLASDGLAARLRRWLTAEMAAHDGTHYVLVVGGGRLVDVVRDLDARHDLDVQTTHWACIELMDVTARLVAAMLPNVPVEDDYEALRRRCQQSGATVFCPGRFLGDVEPRQPGTRLVADWTVTSDSIAARLAVALPADELVLVKSALPPADSAEELEQLAAVGYIDAFLPRLAGELPPLRMTTLDIVATDER